MSCPNMSCYNLFCSLQIYIFFLIYLVHLFYILSNLVLSRNKWNEWICLWLTPVSQFKSKLNREENNLPKWESQSKMEITRLGIILLEKVLKTKFYQRRHIDSRACKIIQTEVLELKWVGTLWMKNNVISRL